MGFDGVTISEDPGAEARLTSQLARVKALMLPGDWWALQDIAARVGGSEAGVSARLRDLRKEKHGGYTVERRLVRNGLWEYRVLEPELQLVLV